VVVAAVMIKSRRSSGISTAFLPLLLLLFPLLLLSALLLLVLMQCFVTLLYIMYVVICSGEKRR